MLKVHNMIGHVTISVTFRGPKTDGQARLLEHFPAQCRHVCAGVRTLATFQQTFSSHCAYRITETKVWNIKNVFSEQQWEVRCDKGRFIKRVRQFLDNSTLESQFSQLQLRRTRQRRPSGLWPAASAAPRHGPAPCRHTRHLRRGRDHPGHGAYLHTGQAEGDNPTPDIYCLIFDMKVSCCCVF